MEINTQPDKMILMTDNTFSNNEIILYQPDSTLTLDVRLENETVWLTQAQMTELFMRDRTVITRHINNIFKEKELEEKSNVHILHIANSDKPVKFYSLDVIISVGYRVKSVRGTQFRQWANKVLKNYLLKGYSVNQRFQTLEDKIDRRYLEHETRLNEMSDKIDFFVRTSLPPKEGIFFDGQIFDAYTFICDLIRRAERRIILIDNYINENVLVLLSKRASGVIATIYTKRIDRTLQLDIERHNDQYIPISVCRIDNFHDRFLIIDETLYHIGASIKDLGVRLFAFTKMELSPDIILEAL